VFIYMMLLCASVPISYLIQFQAYSHYHEIDVSEDSSEVIGLPIVNVFERELAVDGQLSGV
jgi:hypothetical protein